MVSQNWHKRNITPSEVWQWIKRRWRKWSTFISWWYMLHILLLLHPFNGLFSRTTWVIWHQKGKTILDFNEARNDGVAVASAGWMQNINALADYFLPIMLDYTLIASKQYSCWQHWTSTDISPNLTYSHANRDERPKRNPCYTIFAHKVAK